MQAGKPLLSHSATPECGRQASKIPATPSLLGKPQIAVQCSHAPFLLSMHYTPSAPLSRNTHTYGTGSKKPMIFMWFTSSASLPSPSWVCSLSLTQSGVCLSRSGVWCSLRAALHGTAGWKPLSHCSVCRNRQLAVSRVSADPRSSCLLPPEAISSWHSVPSLPGLLNLTAPHLVLAAALRKLLTANDVS